jgi:hypothetical protein
LVDQMIAVFVVEHEVDAPKQLQRPGGQHVDELVVVKDHQVARTRVSNGVDGVKKPGERDADFWRIPVATEPLAVSEATGVNCWKPFRGSAGFGLGWRGEDNDFVSGGQLQASKKIAPLG